MKKHFFNVGIIFLALIFAFTFTLHEASAKKIERKMVDINKSVTDNGITLTVNQAIKDGHERIIMEVRIKSDRDIELTEPNDNIIERPDIQINGGEINAGASSYDIKKIGKNEYAGVIEILPDHELPDHYKVKFNVDALLNQPGQWTIYFSL
jgi:hypothetical protein